MLQYLKVVFDYTKDTLDQFNKSLKTANTATEELKKNTKEAGKSAESMGDQASKGINQLVTGVKAFLALQVVQEIRAMVNEASKFAAASEGIANSFKNLGGTTKDIKDLSDAVGGTVSNLKLMQIYIDAVQKGIDKSTLVEVLTFSEKQAKATGKSLEAVADAVVKGLGKGSSAALKQFGLNVEAIGKNGTKVKFTADALAEMTRVSSELGSASSKAADDTDKLTASQENLKLAIGNLVNSTGWTELKAFLATGVQRLADSIDDPFRLALRSDKGLQDLIDNASKNLARLQKQAEDVGFLDFANRGAIKDKAKQQTAILAAAQAELKLRKEAAVKNAAAIAAAEAEALKAAQDADREEAIKKRAEADALAYARAISEASKKARQLVRDEQLKADREDFVQNKAQAGFTDLDRLREINFELENRPGKKAKDVNLDAPVELEDATKEIDKNLQSAANSMFSIYDLMSGLGQEESGPQKFLKILSGILGIVGSIPGVGTGFGIAGSILGGIGARLNTGGWVGGLGGNNDSVHALLTPKEFVVNRNAAATSPRLLEAINAGKLNDRLLTKMNDVSPVVIVEQDKVVKAIQSMPQVDFYKQGSILFETRMSADKMRSQRKARITI